MKTIFSHGVIPKNDAILKIEIKTTVNNMTKSISLLLGAGFFAPIGYPIGDQLNKHLVNCTGDEFAFHSGGTLAVSTDGKKPNFGYKTSYDIEFDFCKVLIKYFNDNRGYFDYEEFYDFMKDEAKTDKNLERLAKPYISEFGTVDQLIHSLGNIYAQLISYYLKDGNGEA